MLQVTFMVEKCLQPVLSLDTVSYWQRSKTLTPVNPKYCEDFFLQSFLFLNILKMHRKYNKTVPSQVNLQTTPCTTYCNTQKTSNDTGAKEWAQQKSEMRSELHNIRHNVTLWIIFWRPQGSKLLSNLPIHIYIYMKKGKSKHCNCYVII